MPPMDKVGGMAIRALTKPIVTEMKQISKTQPWMKQTCEAVGNRVHRWTIVSSLSLRTNGKTAFKIKDLSSDDAFKKGAEFLGETFIFAVAVGVLTFDYTRSSAKAAQKEKAQLERDLDDFLDIDARFRRLESSMHRLQHSERDMHMALNNLSWDAIKA